MLDRDETALQQVTVSVDGHGLLDTKNVVLADIRDADAIRDIMLTRRPDVVFHAAAHKHDPLLEENVIAASTNNVFGTLNVVDAALASGCTLFDFISTDHAVRATSVVGAPRNVA